MRADIHSRPGIRVRATVGELADAEPLLALPALAFPATIEVTRIVAANATVAFRGNRYSTPPGLDRQRADVAASAQQRHRRDPLSGRDAPRHASTGAGRGGSDRAHRRPRLFGTRVSFVPLAGAEVNGDEVVVPYDKDVVKDAPNADADDHLDPQEEQRLYEHYNQDWSAGAEGWSDRRRRRRPRRRRSGHQRPGDRRCDDPLRRGTRRRTATREAGRVRLRKWVETEDVNITVPVRREKAKLVTEPITDANVDSALSGGDLTSDEHEVVLSEEVVDVDKRVVPKERVRLETEVETDEVVVDEEVRKERIEMDDGADRMGDRR